MVAATATKPPRASLAKAAEELGGTPVTTEEVEVVQETEAGNWADEVRIAGEFDGFAVTYITRVSPDNVALELGQITSALKACGFSPLATKPQAPSGNPAPAQNRQQGGPPQGNRGGGGYGGGQQRGGGFGGRQGGGYQQREDFSGQEFDWQVCGHPSSAVKRGKFGLECGHYEDYDFEGSRSWWDAKNGRERFYCTVREGR